MLYTEHINYFVVSKPNAVVVHFSTFDSVISLSLLWHDTNDSFFSSITKDLYLSLHVTVYLTVCVN